MKKTVQNLLVVSNQQLNKDQTLLGLKSDVPLEEIFPGQFANILVDKSHQIFLRRPFSIYQVDYKSNTLYFLIKAIGEGTKCLSKSAVGDTLSVIFPLGNRYSIPQRKSKVLLVGGGVGVAALMILAGELHKAGHCTEILLGARSADDLVELDVFSRYGSVHTTTEDGTMGTKGFVSDHPVFGREFCSFDRVYTCGPEPMMKAVARLSGLGNIPCEVSLENTMACGYGVCLCCVTDTIEGHQCVCTDGPVFDAKKLKWQN
jgi:dihydroorotate dehydrogenase electron transfer subunit